MHMYTNFFAANTDLLGDGPGNQITRCPLSPWQTAHNRGLRDLSLQTHLRKKEILLNHVSHTIKQKNTNKHKKTEHKRPVHLEYT